MIEGNLLELFNREARKFKIYLRATKTKGANFDPFRNTGYTVTLQNPIYKKAVIRSASPEKLLSKELGLVLVGAKELIVKTSDLTTIKAAQKIEIDGEFYVTQIDALGNKMAIFNRPGGFSRVILFKAT